MQQAYISESVAVGNWKVIGYSAPGDKQSDTQSKTVNFTYDDAGSYTNNTAAITASTKGLSVKPNAKLNDCAANTEQWSVVVSAAEGSVAADAVTFTSSTNCAELTPSFANIGK